MGTYKPAKSPYYHFDFRFRGERHHGSTGCTSKRQADAFERRYRHDLVNPANARLPITVDEACGLYADHAETMGGWGSVKYLIKAIVRGLGPNRPLSTISQRELQLYVAKRRNGRKNASVNREIDILRAVWRCAEKAKYEIGEMPEWKSLYLVVQEVPPRELSLDEEDAIFEAIPADAYDVVMFALISGWRKSEVIGLRWQDVFLDRASAQTRIKGGRVAMRALNASLVALIANQPKVGPFVFTYVCRKSRGQRRKGERYPMTVTALRTRWDDARAGAEIQGFRFHDLRHTAATRILRATQNLATTARVLEHSNLKTTMRYAHVLDQDVRDALDAGISRNIPEPLIAKARKT